MSVHRITPPPLPKDELQVQNEKNNRMQAELHETIDGLKEFC